MATVNGAGAEERDKLEQFSCVSTSEVEVGTFQLEWSEKKTLLNIQWLSYSSEKNFRPTNDGESTSAGQHLFYSIHSLSLSLQLNLVIHFIYARISSFYQSRLFCILHFAPFPLELARSLTFTFGWSNFKKEDADAFYFWPSLIHLLSQMFIVTYEWTLGAFGCTWPSSARITLIHGQLSRSDTDVQGDTY